MKSIAYARRSHGIHARRSRPFCHSKKRNSGRWSVNIGDKSSAGSCEEPPFSYHLCAQFEKSWRDKCLIMAPCGHLIRLRCAWLCGQVRARSRRKQLARLLHMGFILWRAAGLFARSRLWPPLLAQQARAVCWFPDVWAARRIWRGGVRSGHVVAGSPRATSTRLDLRRASLCGSGACAHSTPERMRRSRATHRP